MIKRQEARKRKSSSQGIKYSSTRSAVTHLPPRAGPAACVQDQAGCKMCVLLIFFLFCPLSPTLSLSLSLCHNSFSLPISSISRPIGFLLFLQASFLFPSLSPNSLLFFSCGTNEPDDIMKTAQTLNQGRRGGRCLPARRRGPACALQHPRTLCAAAAPCHGRRGRHAGRLVPKLSERKKPDRASQRQVHSSRSCRADPASPAHVAAMRYFWLLMVLLALAARPAVRYEL